MGAEKYTDFLANYIQDNYSLDDKRTDYKYSEWSHLYESFKIKTYEAKDEILRIKAEKEKVENG